MTFPDFLYFTFNSPNKKENIDTPYLVFTVARVLPLSLALGSFDWSFYPVLFLEKDRVFRGRVIGTFCYNFVIVKCVKYDSTIGLKGPLLLLLQVCNVPLLPLAFSTLKFCVENPYYIFKQFRPRSEGSYGSPLILICTVWKCIYYGLNSQRNWYKIPPKNQALEKSKAQQWNKCYL